MFHVEEYYTLNLGRLNLAVFRNNRVNRERKRRSVSEERGGLRQVERGGLRSRDLRKEMMNKAFGQLMEAGDRPAFFKILRRGDLSTEIKRMVPNHLLRSISDEFSFRMVLKVLWGSWVVKLSKNPTFYYMEDHGWNKFVEDNGLGDDESLTFTHEGNMRFKVTIFEADGEEMLEPRRPEAIPSSSSMNRREEMKRNYVEVKEEEEIESLSESSHTGPRTAEPASGRLKQKQELNLRKKKAEEAETSKKKAKEAETSKKKKKKVETANNDSEAGTSKKKKKKKVETANNDSEAGTSSLVPEFKLTFKKTHFSYLWIPIKFLEHMPKETKEFTIHHPRGKKSWEVMWKVTDAQSRFSAGWASFVKDLGLAVGDVCTFKLIKPTEMSVEVSKE